MTDFNSQLQADIESILSTLEQLAWQRMGGAWRTSYCVVGKDMLQGIVVANETIQSFEYSAHSTRLNALSALCTKLNEAAQNYNGYDDEGYVVGTIVDIANQLESLK